MNKRNGIILFLLLNLLLAGCMMKNTVVDNLEPITVTVWHYYNGKQKESFDALLENFNQTEGLKKGIVVIAESKGTISNLEESIIAAAGKKAGSEILPDITATYADTAIKMQKFDLLIDINQYMTKEELNEYNPFFLVEGSLTEDGLQILPVAKATELLYLNKTDWDVFAKENGYDLSIFSTWEGIRDVAEVYYEWSKGKTFFGRDAAANFMLVGFHQFGKDIFQESQGKVNIVIDNSILKIIWDTYGKPYIQGYYGAFGKFRSDDLKTGDIVAAVASTSSVTYYPKEIALNNGTTYPIEMIVLPLPDFYGTEKCVVQQGAGMAVFKSTKTKETAAVEFLKWFTSEEQNISFCVDTGYLPVKTNAGINELMKETLDNMNISKDELIYKNTILGLETILNSDLYSPIPFEDGNAKRNIITKYLTEKLDNYKKNYNEIEVEQRDSFLETCYEEWIMGFKNELEH